MKLLLNQAYSVSVVALFAIVTTFTFPIILLIQRNKTTREWYYSNIFGVICRIFSKFLFEPKRKLFELVDEHFKGLAKSGNVIRVLEIGPGTGDNFKYYKSPIDLSVIDLNPLLKKTAQKLALEYPLVNVVDSQITSAENMTCFQDNSFDIVCGTLVMCCINNNQAALNEIHRVLKPKGRYYYLEGNRMRSSRSSLARFLQAITAIFWQIFEYGCKFMGNNFDKELESSKLGSGWQKIYEMRESAIGHELRYGCAIKIK